MTAMIGEITTSIPRRAHAHDLSPISRFRAPCNADAIITPDGEWHEAGRMVSFAIVLDEKPDVIWDDEVASLLTKYQNGYLAVVVDCHT